MHILLIEDNPADVYLMQEEFAAIRGDHRMEVAGTVAAAKAAIEAARPDVVLMDLSLPDSLGLESFSELHEQYRDLPVIILSGNADRTTAIDAVRAGAQDYVLKSRMDPEVLYRTLQYAIERARVKADLRRSEARYRRLFDSVPVSVFQLNGDFEMMAVNATMVATLGFSSELEVLRAARVGSLYANEVQVAAARSLLHSTGMLDGFEVNLYHRDGSQRTMLVSAASFDDAHSGDVTIEGTMIDITERKEAERQLRVQAEVDELTGIVNRRAFRAISVAAMTGAESGYPRIAPALLMFDLDGFKAVNDTLGHAAGDELLRAIANRVGGALRDGDTFARLGGDEFAVLCNIAEPEHIARVAEKVITEVSRPMQIDGQEVAVGASVGIAMYPRSGTDFDTLMGAADNAMYHAKRNGKGRYCFAIDCEPLSQSA